MLRINEIIDNLFQNYFYSDTIQHILKKTAKINLVGINFSSSKPVLDVFQKTGSSGHDKFYSIRIQLIYHRL